MNKYQIKQAIFKREPHCSNCGCKLVIHFGSIPKPNGRSLSHEAVLKDGSLICYRCHRVEIKRIEFNKLPMFKKFISKLDDYTKVPTIWKKIKRTIGNFIFFKIKKGKPNGRKPKYFGK
jgi:hypothetical protein